MMKAAKHVLVAGGAGFIGSHLCAALLERGHIVTCLDNMQTARPENLARLKASPRFSFVRADVTAPLPDDVTTPSRPFDRIYNLACAASPPQYQRDPEHTLLTSVDGTRSLLRLAERMSARFLLSSTSEVYGDPDSHPQAEDYRGNVNCIGPRACYDEGKRAAEALTFDFGRLSRAEVRVARIFNTYGPHMHPDDGRVVSNFLCQILRGQDITIYGSGEQTRSFCYVSDMVAGLLALMEAPGQVVGPVNLGNPNEITIAELVDIAFAVTGFDVPVRYEALPEDDPQRRRPNIGLARKLLSWEPQVPLQDGLRATADYFADLLSRSNAARSSPVKTERREDQVAFVAQ